MLHIRNSNGHPVSHLPLISIAKRGSAMRQAKIAVLGGARAGKSSVTTRFVEGTFYENLDSFAENCFWKQIRVDDQDIILEIFDASNYGDCWMDVRNEYLRTSHAFVLVFSLTDVSSVSALSVVRDDILRIRGSLTNFQSILVGNKCDLVDQRVISQEQCYSLQKTMHACAYLETSARFDTRVNEVFYEVVRQIGKSSGTRDEKKSKKLAKCVLT